MEIRVRGPGRRLREAVCPLSVDTHAYDAFTVSRILRLAADRAPGTLAVGYPGGPGLTYRELLDSATRLGNALLGLGLAPGDRVAAWMEDVVEYVQVYAACALAGLVVVPINARLTVHEASFPLLDSDARVVIYTEGLAERVAALTSTDMILIPVTAMDPGVPTLGERIATGSDQQLPPVGPDDLYMIGYTSGTTGRPKGAMLTQGSVATLARMNALAYRLPIGSVAALTGSMSFVSVVPAHIISHFYVAGTALLLGRWNVGSLLDTIEKERVTFTYLPSPLLSDFAVAAAADPRRWRSLVSLLHSGSKASATKLREVADVVGGLLVEGLGMTENSGGLVTATVPGDTDPSRDRLGTVGRAVPEVLITVVDPLGHPLPHDGETEGELVFQSPALMTGYWNNPGATAEAMRDGWYHTGDLGSVDAQGYVRISERRVDLIVSGGMNVYPSEVEEVILTVSGVLACAVVGLPHERWGQTVAASIVVAPGHVLTEADILERCKEMLASFKKPTLIRFVEGLPTTAGLKVSRAQVRLDMSGPWPT